MLNDVEDINNRNELHIYVDGNNIFETICSGFDELMIALKETKRDFPNGGDRYHKLETYKRWMS